MKCYAVQVNPVTNEETVIGKFSSMRECAEKTGLHKQTINYAYHNHCMTKYGLYIMEGEPREADE